MTSAAMGNEAALFQSTLPLRGATQVNLVSRQSLKYFNPHSPCGERPQK